MNPMERSPSPYEGQVDLTELLLVGLKRKGVIVLFTLAVLAGALVYSLLLENRYEATARVFPSPKQGESASSAEFLEDRLIARLFSGQPISDLFVGILESRSVKDRIIEKFDLKSLYGVNTMEGARGTLSRLTTIEFSPKTHLITITVEDGEPQRAARLANAYVDELDRFNRSLQKAAQRLKRKFLEERLEEGKYELLEAESRMKTFQLESGVVELDLQTRTAIEAAARVRAETILARTDLAVLEEFGTGRRNETIRLESRIRVL